MIERDGWIIFKWRKIHLQLQMHYKDIKKMEKILEKNTKFQTTRVSAFIK